MRKIILLQVLLSILQAPIFSQAVPYSTSSVQGSTVITNFSDPTSGNASGPGLSVSPLQSRFSAPLGQQRFGVQNDASTTTPTTVPTTVIPTTVSTTLAPPPGTAVVPGVDSTNAQTFNALNPIQQPAFSQARTHRNIPLLPIPESQTGNGEGFPQDPTYLFPGLVRYDIDKWVGSEYLYNLPASIGVVVEIVNSGDLPYSISGSQIKDNISDIFSTAGINPVAEILQDRPPLPFLHLLIFIAVVNDNYVFTASARYFEEVKLVRLDYKLPGTMQAITWEKQEFVISAPSRLVEQVNTTAKTIAENFISRIRFFQHEKIVQDQQLKLKCVTPRTLHCKRGLKQL